MAVGEMTKETAHEPRDLPSCTTSSSSEARSHAPCLTKPESDETKGTPTLAGQRSSSASPSAASICSSSASSRAVSAASITSFGSFDCPDSHASSSFERPSSRCGANPALGEALEETEDEELFPVQTQGRASAKNDEIDSSAPPPSHNRQKRPSLSRSETIDIGELSNHVRASEEASEEGEEASQGQCLTSEQLKKKRMLRRRSMHIPELLLPGTAELRRQSIKSTLALQQSPLPQSPSREQMGKLLSPSTLGSPLTMSVSSESLMRMKLYEPSGAISAPSSPMHRRSYGGISSPMHDGSDSDSPDGGTSPFRITGSRRANSFKFPLRVSSPDRRSCSLETQANVTPDSPVLSVASSNLHASVARSHSITMPPRRVRSFGSPVVVARSPREKSPARRLLQILRK